MYFVHFFTWCLILYWIHRIVHILPKVRKVHLHHHKFIFTYKTKWHWSNLLLFNDTWTSTLDLWITEVIPTLFFSYITEQWWISIFYYIWAAFIQEEIEHNKNFNLLLFTSGKWHLIHHVNISKNFSVFFPIWDIIFGTYKNVDE